jgi:hypothetical protein
MIDDTKSVQPEVANREPTKHTRWRRELILAASCLGFGLFVMPALIYLVGVPLLGAYGGGPHIGSFYGDFFRNLIGGAGRTWFIVIGTYLVITVLRLIFVPWGTKLPMSQPGPGEDQAQPPARKERREPFVAP